jgi:hypothetical protein
MAKCNITYRFYVNHFYVRKIRYGGDAKLICEEVEMAVITSSLADGYEHSQCY